jgi:CBS-domain-containing membrane protein
MMRYLRVADVMTRDVVSVRPETPCRAVADLMIEHRVSGIPVVNYFGHVLGVVSEADLLPKIETARETPPLWRRRSYRRDQRKAAARTAGEVMTSPAVAVMPSLSVPVAVRRMRLAGVKRLAVEDGLGRLVGIVSRGDMLRADSGDEQT